MGYHYETRQYTDSQGNVHYYTVKVIDVGYGTDYEGAVLAKAESEYD